MKKMVLNDLTLEKLVSEINGYKEKMRNIYEEYGRASQDLQDRINVLGYTLNEHLKETKDQIGSTPQRLLNIETRPLASADFKQANPPAPRTLIEEWARNAIPQQAPALAQQAPAPTPTSPSVKFAASSIVSE